MVAAFATRAPARPSSRPTAASNDLSQWLLCFAVVGFDLSKGHVLQATFPGKTFHKADEYLIASSSFPDTNSFKPGDVGFSFQFTETPTPKPLPSWPRKPCAIPRVPARKYGLPICRNEELQKLTPWPDIGERKMLEDSGATGREESWEDINQPNLTRRGPYRRRLPKRAEWRRASRFSGGRTESPAPTGSWVDVSGESDVHVSREAISRTLYATVLFRRVADAALDRGFFQKSLVLISSLPLHGLWSRVMEGVGPAYFDAERKKPGSGMAVLRQVVKDMIFSWHFPEPGAIVNLPLLGRVIRMRFRGPLEPSLIETSGFAAPQLDRNLLADIINPALFETFAGNLEALWTCWELVLLNKPLVVVSSSPKTTSNAVLALCDLIAPIPFGGDCHPYVTIQFRGLRDLERARTSGRGLIIGITNPHLLQQFSEWPHVLRLGEDYESPQNEKSRQCQGCETQSRGLAATFLQPRLKSWFLPLQVYTQGLRTKHQPIVAKDRGFLRTVVELSLSSKTQPSLIDSLLRRHFQQLTSQFLRPLESFMSTLYSTDIMPMESFLHPAPRFSAGDFLRILAEQEPPFPIEGRHKFAGIGKDWHLLYQEFLHTPNFKRYSRILLAAVRSRQCRRYIRSVKNLDVFLMTDADRQETVERVEKLMEPLRVFATTRRTTQIGSSKRKRALRLKEELGGLGVDITESSVASIQSRNDLKWSSDTRLSSHMTPTSGPTDAAVHCLVGRVERGPASAVTPSPRPSPPAASSALRRMETSSPGALHAASPGSPPQASPGQVGSPFLPPRHQTFAVSPGASPRGARRGFFDALKARYNGSTSLPNLTAPKASDLVSNALPESQRRRHRYRIMPPDQQLFFFLLLRQWNQLHLIDMPMKESSLKATALRLYHELRLASRRILEGIFDDCDRVRQSGSGRGGLLI